MRGWNIFRYKGTFSVKGVVILMTLMLAVCTSCEDAYWPDLDNKYESLLVVDGLITNAHGPYTVKLSLTTDLQHPQYTPVRDCEVIISDNEGNEETLTEVDKGIYKTKPDGIQGVIGRSYKVTIHRPEGKTYSSDFEELLPPVAIDTVYPVIEYTDAPGFPLPMPGYQFYITTKPTGTANSYLRWEMEQTFEYKVDFMIYYYYNGALHEFPNHDSLQTCWKTDPVRTIFTTSTEGLAQHTIENFPLHYISFDTREFSIRYSLLINQLTISPKAYNFWNDVNEQNTEGGTLYTHLPYQITGNVYNTVDSSEPVPGYFQVASVSSRRIFVDRPPPTIPMYYSFCSLQDADYKEYGFMFMTNDPKEWPKYVTEDSRGGRAVPVKACTDCREHGGTIEKPDFWEE